MQIKKTVMKKFAPIVAIALLGMMFTSCKKAYTCTCTITSNGVSVTGSGTSQEKMSKKDAKAACDKGDSSANGITSECEIN